jgi:uncharacterized spore protein YtfJ
MKTNVEDVLNRMTEFLKNETKTETVIGKEFKLGEFTCVPVMRVGLGFGFGGGEGEEGKSHSKGEGTGAGAGFGLEPLGFLVTRGELINFVPSKSPSALATAIEKMPEVIERIAKRTPEPAMN